MMAGLLFARAGCKVSVLEKHADFFRDFRGDTVHPSTMEILDQLGMLQRFLKRPHNQVDTRPAPACRPRMDDRRPVSHLDTPAPFIAMMPQWDFLDFLREEAKAFPGFHLEMEAPVDRLPRGAGQRSSASGSQDGRELRARLTIAADGRASIVRQHAAARRPRRADGRLLVPHRQDSRRDTAACAATSSAGRLLVMIDRGDYWQCAFLIPKGAAEEYQARGIDAIREEVAAAAPPELDLAELDEITDLHLLTVKLDRLTRWHQPGLLAIGDAAHAMSPIGGIGINLAIQDAVAAANILAGPLAAARTSIRCSSKVQERRMFPTRAIQGAQKPPRTGSSAGCSSHGAPIRKAPLIVRLLDRFPLLRRIPGRLIGLGIRRERVRSPAAASPRP